MAEMSSNRARSLVPALGLALGLLLCGVSAHASRVVAPHSGLVTRFNGAAGTVSIDGTSHPISSSAVVHRPDGSVRPVGSANISKDSRVGYTLDPRDGKTVTGLWVRSTGAREGSRQ